MTASGAAWRHSFDGPGRLEIRDRFHRLHRRGGLGRRRRFPRGRRGGDCAHTRDQVARGRQGLSGVRGFPHVVQFVERGLQHADRGLVRRNASRLERGEERLYLVAQVTHGADAGHARPALQRVQDTLEFRDAAAIGAVRGPCRERRIRLLEQFGRFLAEDRRNVGVEVGLGLRVGRRHRGFRGRHHGGGRRDERLRR